MNSPGPYRGYLAAHTELIRTLHEGGASTAAIAEALFAHGARAQSSNPYSVEMNRAAHLVNLRAMVIHIQRRLGLRVRRFRILNLTANKEEAKRRPV